MNNKISSNFLLLKDHEQINIINHLKGDYKRKDLYLHFAQLYTMKMNYLKDKRKKMLKQPNNNIYIQQNNKAFSNNNFQNQNVNNNFQNQNVNKNLNNLQNINNNFQNINLNNNFPTRNNLSQIYQGDVKNVVNNSIYPFHKSETISEPPINIQKEGSNLDMIKNNLKELRKKKKNVKQDEPVVEKQLIKKEFVPNFSAYMQKFLVQEKLKKIVDNKNVAIIGPANYLINLNQGEELEKYDIIIRFNSGINVDTKLFPFIGQKTDIWIYNFKDISILDNLPEKLPKLIFCPYPKEVIDNYNINKPMPNCPIEFIEPSFYSQLQTAMEFEPNSALMTILILLRQNIKSLYVTGISFLYDGYYNDDKKNKDLQSGALTINKGKRNNFMSILKKIYNVNEKLILDNTIVNLIYPNFINVLNNLFIKENLNKLFSTLNYMLFVPSFQLKYNQPNMNTKIYVHFGNDPIDSDLPDKMNLLVHSIKPKMYENEIYIKSEECNYDDLELLLKLKSKGIVYFSNNPWTAIDNMVPKKNKDYILRHHCYVNGNIYGSFINYIVKDFDMNEDNKNINMLYMLFSLIYFGQKIVYLSKDNVLKNGLREVVNVMNKLNLIKYIK